MGTGRHDFKLRQGNTFNPVLTWSNPDGTAINLTGYTARMQIRRSTDATSSLIEATTENGRITLGGSAGTITFDIAAADTAALPTGIFRYDLEIVSGGGVVTTILEGDFTIGREVTR